MYIVLEIQKNDGQVSIITNNYEDILDAESKYHTILAFASKSSVEVHTSLIMTEYGFILKQEHYEHPKQSEPEVIPEETSNTEEPETPEPEENE